MSTPHANGTGKKRIAIEQNAAEIKRTLQVVRRDSSAVFEIRILGVKPANGRGKRFDASGVFNDIDKAAVAVAQYELEHDVEGIYITVNVPDPRTFARSPNAITDYAEKTTSDNDVLRRQWLFIDCDPIRPSGVAATEDDLAAACRFSEDAKARLREEFGFPSPVEAMSGNGYYLLYAIDLPNDAESKALVSAVLNGLQKLTADLPAPSEMHKVKVDCTAFNAGRVLRLLGTQNCKGHSTDTQPHRRSRLLFVPDVIENVPVEKLRELAEAAPGKDQGKQNGTFKQTTSGRPKDYGDHEFLMREYLNDRGVRILQERQSDDWLNFDVVCPFDASHVGTDAAFGLHRGGAQNFKCFHDSCRGRNWGNAKELLGAPDPERHYDPPMRKRSEGPSKTTASGAESKTTPPPWHDPIPLGTVPNVAPFPVQVFPSVLADLAQEMAWAINCPTDFVGVPMLVFGGGAVANSRHLSITRTHRQAPCLFAGYIGKPGTTKSAPLKILRRPLDRMQERYCAEWQHEMEAWEESKPKGKKGGDEAGKKEKVLPRPILKRCIVSDSTTESLAVTLSESPRGVVMVRPELTALMASMNQYKAGGKGQDRQVYLSLWDGDTIIIDRKSDKTRMGAPLYVPCPFTSIIGTIQPDVLRALRGDVPRGGVASDDGFIDRWLFAYPEPLRAIGEEWRDVSESALRSWDDTIERLLQLSMVPNDDSELRPWLVPLSGCGRDMWQEFTAAHAAEVNDPDFPAHLFGPWSKLKGYCGRLSLIVHFLRWACRETEEQKVDGESVARAVMLIDYFKSHARKVYAAMDADPKIASARKVLRWIIANRLMRFSKRDAHQAQKGTFKTIEEFEQVLAVLEKHGLIRPEDALEHNSRGRKPSPYYEVHPQAAALNSENSGNSENGGDSFSTPSEPTSSDEENTVLSSQNSHYSQNSPADVPTDQRGDAWES